MHHHHHHHHYGYYSMLWFPFPFNYWALSSGPPAVPNKHRTRCVLTPGCNYLGVGEQLVSPSSCGSSWQSTARDVANPERQESEKAAPMARPSAKLWMLSPIVIIYGSRRCSEWEEKETVKRTMGSIQPYPFLLSNYWHVIIICVIICEQSVTQHDSEWCRSRALPLVRASASASGKGFFSSSTCTQRKATCFTETRLLFTQQDHCQRKRSWTTGA